VLQRAASCVEIMVPDFSFHMIWALMSRDQRMLASPIHDGHLKWSKRERQGLGSTRSWATRKPLLRYLGRV
jgi:hypothetical protein